MGRGSDLRLIFCFALLRFVFATHRTYLPAAG